MSFTKGWFALKKLDSAKKFEHLAESTKRVLYVGFAMLSKAFRSAK